MESLQDNVYVLCLRAQRTGSVEMGALGPVEVESKWVYYAGRASRGWSSRMKRFQKNFMKHWHVDYLVKKNWIGIEGILPVNRPAKYECELSQILGSLEEMKSLAYGFGASDCAENCQSHGWAGSRSPGIVFDRLSEATNSSGGWWEFNARVCRWTTFNEEENGKQ